MSDISRSVYQKVCEENKRLKVDINILVSKYPSALKFFTIKKWRNKIEADESFNRIMKQAVRNYIKENKDNLPDFLTKKLEG